MIGQTRFERIAAERPRHSSVAGPEKASCMWTGSGYLDLAKPRPESIYIRDIAKGLAYTNRYNGISGPISVGAHSLACVQLAREDGIDSPGVLLQLLMHDAAEAYVGDAIRAVKEVLPEFCDLEGRIWSAIARRYDLPEHLLAVVKHYDNLSLALEKEHLIGAAPGDWPGLPATRGRKLPSVYRLEPLAVELDFLGAARDLLAACGRRAW